MATAAPKPISLDRARRIPERRARSLHRRGVLLIIDHAHVARVLAIRAEMEGAVS